MNTDAIIDQLQNATLETAAKICEAQYTDPSWHPYYRQAGANCAAAIRALISPPVKGGAK